LPPVDFIRPHRLVEALRYKLVAVCKQEALAAAQPAHRVRDKNLASPGLRLMPLPSPD
jgi:hypothetical protein